MFLTASQFVSAARSWESSTKPRSIGDVKDWEDWCWVEDKKRKGWGFLRKVKSIANDATTESSDSELEEDEKVEFEAQVETDVLDHCTTEYMELEMHVVYSETYNVPVMYFNVRRKGTSRCLTLRQIQRLLPKAFEHDNHHRSFVTQEHHPILGVPFFCLHPCQTRECLEIMLREYEDKDTKHALCLLSWYSAVVSSPLCLDQPVHGLSRLCADLRSSYLCHMKNSKRVGAGVYDE